METKNYCTQNQGRCQTCSLVNYGFDCRNNKVDYSLPEDHDYRHMTKHQIAAQRAAKTALGLVIKRDKRWSVTLTQNEITALDKKAAEEGLSRPEFILKYCLPEYREKETKQNNQ